jgi:cbb3-type cytochrome oxidase subunit 3
MSLCNTQSKCQLIFFESLSKGEFCFFLNLALTLPAMKHGYSIINSIVFILVVCLGLIFIIIGITLSIYRRRSKKSHNQYSQCVISDGAAVLFLTPR